MEPCASAANTVHPRRVRACGGANSCTAHVRHASWTQGGRTRGPAGSVRLDRTCACASRAAACRLARALYTRKARCGQARSPGCRGACSSRVRRYGAASGPRRCAEPETTTCRAREALRVSLSSSATTATFRAAVISTLHEGRTRVLMM